MRSLQTSGILVVIFSKWHVAWHVARCKAIKELVPNSGDQCFRALHIWLTL